MGEEVEGAEVEGVDLELSVNSLIPPLVTFLGGAIATILTGPRGRDLMIPSASASLFPSKFSSLTEIRWSPTLMQQKVTSEQPHTWLKDEIIENQLIKSSLQCLII